MRVGVGGSRAPPGYLRPVCSEVCACGLVFLREGRGWDCVECLGIIISPLLLWNIPSDPLNLTNVITKKSKISGTQRVDEEAILTN